MAFVHVEEDIGGRFVVQEGFEAGKEVAATIVGASTERDIRTYRGT